MDTIRAWKDPEYRASLSVIERSRLAASPAGTVRTDGWLATAGNGQRTIAHTPPLWTNMCCFYTVLICEG